MTQIQFFEVGGCVRDEILGLRTKDIDFAVIAPSFEAMEAELEAQGFKIWQSNPEFVTIRAGVPEGHPLRSRTKDADFVLARKDSATGDGRRPDFVEPGTLLDDLARRDFTVNAIARDPETGEFIDPFDGIGDLKDRSLRFVGDPFQRISEDGLRVLRGFRFMVTKGLAPKPSEHGDTFAALRSDLAVEMLSCVSVERIGDEIDKMFAHSTLDSLALISTVMTHDLREAIFRDGLRLTSTLKGRKT